MACCSSFPMRCNSAQHRDQIFIKGYGFLSFVKTMGKKVAKVEVKT